MVTWTRYLVRLFWLSKGICGHRCSLFSQLFIGVYSVEKDNLFIYCMPILSHQKEAINCVCQRCFSHLSHICKTIFYAYMVNHKYAMLFLNGRSAKTAMASG